MRRLLFTLVLSVSLALAGTVHFSWAQGVKEKVRALSNKAAKDYLTQGLMLAGEGNRDEDAAKAFRQAISLRPNWAEAHSLLGSALARAGKYREAQEELRKAVKLDPNYAEGWYYLGRFLKDRGKTQEAEQAFRKAKQLAH